MDFALVLSMSFLAAVANGHQTQVQLKPDKPFQRVQISENASIECCYSCKENTHVTWIMNIHIVNGTTKPRFVNLSDEVKAEPMTEVDGVKCHRLILKNVRVDDTALYQCFINLTSRRFSIFTHGTFLQVYIPMHKTFDLSESAKNSIIIAEGVLLLLCVLIPGTMLLCKGLNLDDCNSIYHQIQRSHVQGPYQDVACGEIQLEKP
ncbi:B-cell antigen receptor complex-associated protein alpha chain [Triplophysa tibetana]|uniref:B-cell antigen receptor complex-associated protein alpha chain n=1 Tax=Triplophysa tibetana TaxID=1572043 RepID=A0A5A9N2Y2_9TELE|nr:B-cell antigen receptor complex-associated protein alpha chain [Triplophysa tibetana]